LLARSVVQGYGGRARFVSENYGDSALAKKYGVTRYPAIFVDDVLVATPNDFGFYGPGEKEEGGRYAPLKSAKAHERFRGDLTKMIDLELAGRKDAARALAAPASGNAIASMPAFDAVGLDGKPVRAADLKGRIVLVEMWATWCPPCRGTLGWLGELKKRYGDRLEVVAVAIESEEKGVRKLAGELGLPLRWVMGSPELVRSFGDIGAVPTLFLFDGTGKTVDVFYGAPPTLHGAAETKLAGMLKK
jgi:thiol-disulfide isomerase/thioredoxin